MIRTFLDSGVLIAASRMPGPSDERVLKLLDDPGRIFLTSPFVYLEVAPKSIFYKRHLECKFYDRFFENAQWYRDLGKIEAAGRTEAIKLGLAAMDALHLAAAHLSNAGEFITTEKPAKPIHRSSLVKVRYLFG